MKTRRNILLVITASLFLLVTACPDISNFNDKGNKSRGLLNQNMIWGFASYNVKGVYDWDSSLTLEERVDRVIVDLKAAGAKWYRPNFIWIDIEPEIKRPDMTRDSITWSMISRYAYPENYSDWTAYPDFYRPDWDFYDLLVSRIISEGLNIWPVICNGDSKQLPLYNGHNIIPGSGDISKENYLALTKLHSAAVALRYHNDIQYYQAENELNCAGLQVWPWLARNGYEAWNDWDFQTNLLRTIADSIRNGDSDAVISTNIVALGAVCDWHSHIDDWTSGENQTILDIVGIDSYPNYVTGWPLDTHSVGGCVQEAYEHSNGKPVIVSETGYPTSPWWLYYTESRQKTYVKENMEDAWDNNAIGFFYYRLVTRESSSSGGFPQENYWGFIRKNNSYKPALATFRDKTLEHPLIK